MSTPPTGIDPALIESFRHPATTGNWLRDINPVNELIVLTSLAVLSLVWPAPTAPIVVCLVYVLAGFVAGVGAQFSSAFAKLFAIVGVILFVLRALFLTGGTPLWVWGPFSVTTGGIMAGLNFALNVMALCGALVLFFTITPMKNLMLALENRGLSPRATYVVLASFQAIIDLGKNARTVMAAQGARGIETQGSFVTRTRAFAPVLAPVFLAAMNQTDERAVALDARAFNSRNEHTQLVSLPRVGAIQATLTVLAVVLAVGSIVVVVVR